MLHSALMRFSQNLSVLACDYDGTLANHGKIEPAVARILRKLRETGRKVVLVTGRHLDDLRCVCPDLSLFDMVIAENGGVIFSPVDHSLRALGPPPDQLLIQVLKDRKVAPLEIGKTIIATVREHLPIVSDAIQELGVNSHIVLNKDAVMVLPCPVDKAFGLRHALGIFGIAPSEVVGIGDAENDEAFLSICGFPVAVANALPSVKRICDHVTVQPDGAGVVELLEEFFRSSDSSLSCSGIKEKE